MATPVHIVSGFLGAGKTSAIRSHMAKRRGEKIAVIVNDFGDAGFDEAVIASDAGDDADVPFQITNIPGACVCCTAPEGFVAALGALLEGKPDRLLIEPTGLARPQDLIDTIRRGPHRDQLELAPVIVLVDPRRLAKPSPEEEALIAEQAEVADVLVANHADACTPEQLAAFDAWAGARWPAPLATLHTTHGEVPDTWLAWPEGEGPRREVASEAHDHTPHDHGAHAHTAAHAANAGGSTEGFVARSLGWPPEVVFERSRIEDAFSKAAARSETQSGAQAGAGALTRAKGLFRTREGFLRIEWTAGTTSVAATAHRRDSRVDLIASGDGDALLATLAERLCDAVLDADELRAQANQIEIVLPDASTRVLKRADVAALDDPIADVSALFPKRSGEAARMAELLDRVGAPREGFAVICAADGFASEPVPLHALREGVLLHGEGGEPLPSKLGGPFRLLIPEGVPDAPSACANVKAVTRIVVRGV